MVCAYSTSRVVSPAQPSRSSDFLYGGTIPAGWITFKEGGAASLKALSKTVRSWPIVGEPKESTMTIVCPAPSIPSLNNGHRL
jgi:hypothetical protein